MYFWKRSQKECFEDRLDKIEDRLDKFDNALKDLENKIDPMWNEVWTLSGYSRMSFPRPHWLDVSTYYEPRGVHIKAVVHMLLENLGYTVEEGGARLVKKKK